jgi:hypothetical protein
MKKINMKLELIFAIVLTAAFLPVIALAQFNLNGEATVSYLRLDDEGNRGSASELYDTYKGFNVQKLSAFGDLNPHTRYFIKLDDVNLDGKKGMLNITNINLFKLKLDYRQTRRIYGPGVDKKNSRKAYSGYLEVKPHEILSAFVDFQGYQNDGDRILPDVNVANIFSNIYDRKTATIKGGLKGHYKNQQMEIAYGQRAYDDRNDALDSKTNFFDLSLYSRINDNTKAVIQYDYARKLLDYREAEIKDNALSLSVLMKPIERLTLAPSVAYRRVKGTADAADSSTLNPQLASAAEDFKAFRIGLDVDYFVPNNSTLMGGFGYESRSVGDETTFKSSVLYYSIGGRTKLNDMLAAKILYSGQNRKDPDKVLITGVESKNKILAELTIRPCKYSTMKAGYQQSERRNSDIDTKAETSSLYGTIDRAFKDFADLSLQGNITNAKYEWSSRVFKYRYYSVTGMLEVRPNAQLTLNSNITYFIFKKDVQQDKINVIAGAYYQFIPDARFGVSYQRYEFNESLYTPAHYAANIIKAEFTVNFDTK